jgi:hypothetical protein
MKHTALRLWRGLGLVVRTAGIAVISPVLLLILGVLLALWISKEMRAGP